MVTGLHSIVVTYSTLPTVSNSLASNFFTVGSLVFPKTNFGKQC